MTKGQNIDLELILADRYEELFDLFHVDANLSIEEKVIQLMNFGNNSVWDLSDQQLKTVPKGIGDFTHIQQLNLSHNQLTSLPNELGKLEQLSNLSLENNQLTDAIIS